MYKYKDLPRNIKEKQAIKVLFRPLPTKHFTKEAFRRFALRESL